MPKLSIITVAFNSGATLEHCIRSVAAQTAETEHILVDGGSTDASHAVIDEYRKNLSEVIIEPDEGIYDAMNKGIRASSGDVIGILNADDFYPDSSVLQAVTAVFENSEIEACYGDLNYVAAQDISKTTRSWRAGSFDRQKFFHGWMPPHPTFFVRRSFYDAHGMYRTDLGSAADYELMLRMLLRHQLQTEYIPRVLVHMRSGGVSNASIRNRLKANRNDRKAWRINGIQPYPWTLLAKPLRKSGQWLLKRQQ